MLHVRNLDKKGTVNLKSGFWNKIVPNIILTYVWYTWSMSDNDHMDHKIKLQTQ